MMMNTTLLAKAITTIRGAFCNERTRSVATTKIHKIETGIKTFQPNCMNWSYRKRGKVPRSHTNTKKKQKKHTQIQRILRLENIVAQLYVKVEGLKLIVDKENEETDKQQK